MKKISFNLDISRVWRAYDRGIKGVAVAIYRKPLITKNMSLPGSPCKGGNTHVFHGTFCVLEIIPKTAANMLSVNDIFDF